jgi:hypothetical protein
MKRTLLLFLLIPFFLGCGPKTIIVTGRVTFLGEPGKDISVLFQPMTEAAIMPPPAMGMTDASGNFKLRLAGENKKAGVMPGEYAVYFAWIDPDDPPETADYKPNPCPYQIPDKARLGRVRFTVPEKGPIVANFDFTEEDLKEKIREGI